MALRKCRTCLILVFLSFAGCTIDGWGLFGSLSAPDERFAHGQSLPSPSWTAGDPGSSFSLVFITDTHILNQNTQVLQKLTPLLTSDVAVLHGGDITQKGDLADFNAWKTWKASLGKPVYEALGNHDLYFSGWNSWKASLGPSAYTLAIGTSLRLLFLDTGNATLGQAQFKWLRQVLDQSTEAARIVVTHYPLVSTNLSGVDYTDPEESLALLDLLAQKNVQMVLSGHTHVLANRSYGPSTHLIGPSFRVEDPSPQALRIHYQNGRLTWSAFSIP